MAFSTGAFSDGKTVFIWKMIQRWLITLGYGNHKFEGAMGTEQ